MHSKTACLMEEVKLSVKLTVLAVLGFMPELEKDFCPELSEAVKKNASFEVVLTATERKLFNSSARARAFEVWSFMLIALLSSITYKQSGENTN
jgi:hypothetical protein